MPEFQGDRPKSARSTNPQYQCGFRAIWEKTERHSRDALLRPRSRAYSIENTGIPAEGNPFRQVPKVTPSSLQSDFAMRASVSRAAAAMGWEICADVSRKEAQAKVPQKVTPWKNDLAETKPHIGIIARHGVTPWRSQSEPYFCLTHRAFPPRRNPTFLLCTDMAPAFVDFDAGTA
jgi:hypothetical protein